MKGGHLNLISSVVVLLITILVLSQTVTNIIIKPRLYDGTINELGRYSFTFDAYEYISENSDDAIIAIGSSKMKFLMEIQLENTLFIPVIFSI